MTQATSTPAPWHICKVTSRDLKLVRDGNGFCVAQAVKPANSRAAYIDSDANARLIAAAPDLLAALDQVDAYLSPFDGEEDAYAEIRSVIQQAIAKAKGE